MTPSRGPALADAVGRLGTESAFAVLARARELEAAGRDVIHLEIGEPHSATPAHVAEAAFAAVRAGETGYCPSAGLTDFREVIATELSTHPRRADPRRARPRRQRAPSPSCSSTSSRSASPATRSCYPDPGFPIYESAIRYAGATPVPLPLREASGFSFDPLRARRPARPADEARDPQLAAEPHRRRRARPTSQAPPSRIRDTDAWVLSDEVYSRLLYEGTFASIASLAGAARAHRRARQPLKDLRDDRVALRLRLRARAARRAARALHRQLDVVRAALRPAGRDRRAHRAAGRRRADARRVPRPARRSPSPA